MAQSAPSINAATTPSGIVFNTLSGPTAPSEQPAKELPRSEFDLREEIADKLVSIRQSASSPDLLRELVFSEFNAFEPRHLALAVAAAVAILQRQPSCIEKLATTVRVLVERVSHQFADMDSSERAAVWAGLGELREIVASESLRTSIASAVAEGIAPKTKQSIDGLVAESIPRVAYGLVKLVCQDQQLVDRLLMRAIALVDRFDVSSLAPILSLAAAHDSVGPETLTPIANRIMEIPKSFDTIPWGICSAAFNLAILTSKIEKNLEKSEGRESESTAAIELGKAAVERLIDWAAGFPHHLEAQDFDDLVKAGNLIGNEDLLGLLYEALVHRLAQFRDSHNLNLSGDVRPDAHVDRELVNTNFAALANVLASFDALEIDCSDLIAIVDQVLIDPVIEELTRPTITSLLAVLDNGELAGSQAMAAMKGRLSQLD